jgi:hypothetical protein
MKRTIAVLAAAVIIAGMLVMTSCGGAFSMTGSEKYASVQADKASADTTSTVGGLEVAEGEKVTITSSLDEGMIRMEVFAGPDEQSADEVPEPEGDPVMTFDAGGSDSVSGTVDPGYYFVKATVKEKATGSVELTVSSAE